MAKTRQPEKQIHWACPLIRMMVPAPHLVERGVDTNVEESWQEGDKLRYNRPIFTGGEGKVTQAPEGGRIKHKVILEYSSDEVSESQLDQISPEYPTAADVAKIKKMKKSMKLTIPCHPTVEGLTKSFIAWYKDHSMTTSLRKALKANGVDRTDDP